MNLAISQSEGRSPLTLVPICDGQFLAKIDHEFTQESGIAPELFKSAIVFHSDVETELGGETSYPIHEALNWNLTRFGHQARENLEGAFFQNEDGTTWQIKLSSPAWDATKQKFRKYESPKGGGSKPYLPPVPPEIIAKITQRYGESAPTDGKFWDWIAANPQLPIVITEGGKKSLCLLSNGYIGISLYGVSSGYRAKDFDGNRIRELIPELFPFIRDRKIILAFDQDEKPKTRKKVALAQTRLAILLERAGARVEVATWDGQLGKGIDDFTVTMGSDALDKQLTEAMPFSQWRIADKLWRRLTLQPTLQTNQADLDKLEINNLPDKGIIAIASAKGTGKTKFIAKQIKDSDKALLGCHRIALSRHLCHRLGLDYRGDIDKINGEFITGSSYTLRIGFCVDSLLSINPQQFEGCDLVIDEVCQVLRHLLTSATCNKDGRRPALLARIRDLIKLAKRVIVADADLDDAAIHYLQQLRGEDSQLFLLNNTHQAVGYPVRFIQSSDRSPICDELIKAIQDLDAGKIFYVTTDSKSLSKTLFQLIYQIYPAKRTLLINADTSGGELEQEFIQTPDKILNQNDYDIVICSPSVATGTSIEIHDKVQAVYGIFMGVSLTDADICQSLSRVREAVPRVVWCANRGRNYCRVSRSTNPIELKGHLFERTGVTTSLIRTSLRQDTQDLIGNFDWQNDPHIHLFASISAEQNWAMANLREALMVRLKVEGNKVEIVNMEVNQPLKNLLKVSRAKLKEIEAEAILNANDLSYSEIVVLEQKEGISIEETHALAKFHLKDFYCVDELTPELLAFDREGRGRGELLSLEAQLNPELAIDRTAKALEKQASWRQDLCPWDIPGTAMRQELRDKLGLTQFILDAIEGAEWIADDVEKLANIIHHHCYLLRSHLSLTISNKMGDIQVVHQMLSQLGIKAQFRWCSDYPGCEGKKSRVYSIDLAHWKLCNEIMERRADKRLRLLIEEEKQEGSPLLFNHLNTTGDLVQITQHQTVSQAVAVGQRRVAPTPDVVQERLLMLPDI